ncbi:hypothetical protein [Ahniella affigens]|nr:hypothetical protein [Ahniella affigens]
MPEPVADSEALAELGNLGLLVEADELSTPVEYRVDPSVLEGPEKILIRHASLPWQVPTEWQRDDVCFSWCPSSKIWFPVLVAVGDAPELSAQGEWETLRTDSAFEQIDVPSRKQLATEGFATLDHLLPLAVRTELARYYRALGDEGYLERRESRGVRRLIAHNHPIARFWHQQLNDRISRLVGAPTKPSYSFVSSYLQGSDLFWHTDRPPCEYTITYLLEYHPVDSMGRSDWPLLVRQRNGQVAEIRQRIGDALIFKGRELSHSRDQLPHGHQSLSLLFHYVDADYKGDLD